ncbi:MAG: CDP-archaeol synthase [Rhodocyclaceae bacterium]|nr:CDP-archaeol synthase [Rhodocyclaceae bacterium]
MPEGAIAPTALPCAIWLVACLSLAGVAHVVWLGSRLSKPFALPIDRGARVGGHRIFGDNKTWRGLMAMPLATALAFALAALVRDATPAWLASGLWPLPPAQMATVGAVAGLAFMLAELPNSFLKRRLGIAPGATAGGRRLRWACFALDRLDSTIGALLAIDWMLPLAVMTWVWALSLGTLFHLLFSFWLYRLRLKMRPT